MKYINCLDTSVESAVSSFLIPDLRSRTEQGPGSRASLLTLSSSFLPDFSSDALPDFLVNISVTGGQTSQSFVSGDTWKLFRIVFAISCAKFAVVFC